MGMLKSDLERVLEIEREGERRLEEVEAAARERLVSFRKQARDLRNDTERRLARQREKRLAELEAELAIRIEMLKQHYSEQRQELSARAERNRQQAVELVLDWLKGGET